MGFEILLISIASFTAVLVALLNLLNSYLTEWSKTKKSEVFVKIDGKEVIFQKDKGGKIMNTSIEDLIKALDKIEITKK